MSIRFTIKHNQSKAVSDSDGVIIRYSGPSEPFKRSSDRSAESRDVNSAGKPIFEYVTGLEEDQVQFYPWYSEDEKKEVKKQIKELKPLIAKFYGGDSKIRPDNQYFWGKDRAVSRLIVSNESDEVFYDTKNPIHALLYLSIIAGAFEDLVAPTKDWADRFQRLHYLALDTEDVTSDDEEEEIKRSEAHAALTDLKRNESPESLFILAWCMQYDTNAFGGYLKSTPLKELVSSHVKFIDGKLVSRKKRSTPGVFIDYAEKWKGQQTRPSLYTEAYIKAGEHYGFVNQRDKKLETSDGVPLGATVEDAITTLHKPKFQQDLEKLRDKVEAKWKE